MEKASHSLLISASTSDLITNSNCHGTPSCLPNRQARRRRACGQVKRSDAHWSLRVWSHVSTETAHPAEIRKRSFLGLPYRFSAVPGFPGHRSPKKTSRNSKFKMPQNRQRAGCSAQGNRANATVSFGEPSQNRVVETVVRRADPSHRPVPNQRMSVADSPARATFCCRSGRWESSWPARTGPRAGCRHDRTEARKGRKPRQGR